MSEVVRPIGDEAMSVLWVAQGDPYASRDHFFDASRAGKAVSVYEMVNWEVDYLRLLFPGAQWSWTDDIGRLGAVKPDVVVFNSNTFALDEFTFSHWMPQVLVYLSDEWGRTPNVHRLTQRIPLVLRQHNHAHYFQPSNVRQIPLGFMSAMFDDPFVTHEAQIATERPYRWSFVGQLKGSRLKALRAFENWGPYFTGPCLPNEVARAYRKSRFVLCPRGNVVMDCFRNYEATVCGAIPVVAGCSDTEFLQSFAQIGKPPWVYARTWRRAQAICADLETNGAVDELQQACLQWWTNEVSAVREAIAAVLPNYSFGEEPAAALSATSLAAGFRRWLRSDARHHASLRGVLVRTLSRIVG